VIRNLLFFVSTALVFAQPSPYQGFKLRSIGPATHSGRVIAFAVHPRNRAHYYVASASGGIWKTVNAGTSWTPVFDHEGSYSIGAIAIDSKNPSTVWAGTGECNAQRSVSYGDGVYRSDDGGKSWKNLGLKKSEHIGRIAIHPKNSNIVYVASQGPLWGPGGDRGLYKTIDGGKTWKNVLSIGENTGVTDVVIDPRNPEVIVAASWQRRRHVYTLIDGGPESAIHKSMDGGATWTKIASSAQGIPNEDLGRITFAMSPKDPSVIYATIEAANKKSGIFRSTDTGSSWEKRADLEFAGMYFGRIYADPVNVERIYVMDVKIWVSDDGGKTRRILVDKYKHVDNHAFWIDPRDPDYYLAGCDGGVYYSHDRGANWAFVSNLPITQFYDVAVDNNAPFYHVYGGTQDNNSQGGPARTRSASGITNADWVVTNGGDGFTSRVDPDDPDTVYSESQYAGLVRYDRRTGERISIKPAEKKGEPPLRWNWDSPLIISPHLHTRLYFAANRLFRSDDRGDTWKAISPDLTREVDRNKLPIMGKVWGPDAVAKNSSTSFYSNITALNESPKKQWLVYAGTDDGLIQVTENGGETWRKIEKFPGVPENTYVARILASQHAATTVYAAFDNHKNADFAAYLLKSTDAGRTWTSIAGDLPPNGPVLAIAEDHVNADLLFVGTEFGLYFSADGGKKWNRLKGGLPTIAVRDLAIQKQMNDLVVATFGRGFYVLDDYSPLRTFKSETAMWPPRDGLLYIQSRPYGNRGKAWQGEAFFVAENPPFGATFTYYLKDALKTKAEMRRDAEKKGSVPYPDAAALRAEAEEEPPTVILTVSDSAGRAIRLITGPVTQGVQRVTWDLREPPPKLIAPGAEVDEFREPPAGPLVMPGTYQVAISKRVNGIASQLAPAQTFKVVVPGAGTIPIELSQFQEKAVKLQREVTGSLEAANLLKTNLVQIRRALLEAPAATEAMTQEAQAIERKLNEILIGLRGDTALRSRNENTPDSISERVDAIVSGQRMSTAKPTATQQEIYTEAAAEFRMEQAKLRTLLDVDVKKLERAMDQAGAPWTPGR
jgi:photosystem II stability/assembly factor-like uncharacterized protein